MTCLTPTRAPKGNERAVVGGIEHRKGVEVLRLPDVVEHAVCVGAVVGRREEREGA